VGLAGRQVVVAGGAVGGMAAALLLARAGHRMDATGAVRSASGATLARIRVPDFGGGLDHVLAIRRSRLHDLLAAAVRAAHPAVALRLGTEVTGAAPAPGPRPAAGRRRRARLGPAGPGRAAGGPGPAAGRRAGPQRPVTSRAKVSKALT
jgi:hypothetical protein